MRLYERELVALDEEFVTKSEQLKEMIAELLNIQSENLRFGKLILLPQI